MDLLLEVRTVLGECALRHPFGEDLRRAETLQGTHITIQIHYKPLYQAMALQPKMLGSLVIEICRALALLSEC